MKRGTVKALASASAAIDDAVAPAPAIATAEDLGDQLARIEAERAAAISRIAELDAFEEEHVLDASDEDLDRNAEEVVRLKRQVVRLVKVAERLAEKLAAAEADAIEDGRRARYAAAAAAAADVQAWVVGAYVEHAAAIGAGLAQLVEVEEQLEAANRDRPAGAPMLDIEAFRALEEREGAVTMTERLAYFDGDGAEVVHSDATPITRDAAGAFWVGSVAKRQLYARHVEEAVQAPGRPRAVPRPLAAAVRLPGALYADADHWPQRSKAWGAAP